MTTGWFPRYSTDGSRLTWERPPGYIRPCWLTDTVEIAHNGVNLIIDGQVTDFLGGNELAAGGGVWAVFRPDPVRVIMSNGAGPLFGAGVPVVNPDGVWGYVDDYNAGIKNLVFGGAIIARGAITDVRASRQAVVWSDGGRTRGWNGAAQDIQAAPVEFRPISIDTPTGPWVGCHTHTGLIVRPFGEARGYRFDNGGQCFYPDWKYTDFIHDASAPGTITAIFTNDRGEQSTHDFPLSVPRVDLSAPAPIPTPVPVPPPTPPPIQEPPPMAIDYLGIVTDVRRKYGHIDPLTREWTPPLGANHWLFLVEVAQRTGTQLFRKEGGERVFIPPLKLSVNQNLIGRGTLGNQWADILVDAENQAKPDFRIGETPADGPYIDVSGIVLPGGPVPPPVPPPTQPPAVDLTARVVALETDVSALRSGHNGLINAINSLREELQAAEARLGARIGAGAAMDPAALRATVEAILSGYEASGNTSRTIAHSHTVKLAITRKP